MNRGGQGGRDGAADFYDGRGREGNLVSGFVTFDVESCVEKGLVNQTLYGMRIRTSRHAVIVLGYKNRSADSIDPEKRSNDTHLSTTDPDARLFTKLKGNAAKLCYIGKQ
jgi:hypothetical protein